MKKYIHILAVLILVCIFNLTLTMEESDKEQTDKNTSPQCLIVIVPTELLLEIFFNSTLNSDLLENLKIGDCLDKIRKYPSTALISLRRTCKYFNQMIDKALKSGEFFEHYNHTLKDRCINFYKPLLKHYFLKCLHSEEAHPKLKETLAKISAFLSDGENSNHPILAPVLYYTTLYPWITSTYNLVDLLIFFGANTTAVDPKTNQTVLRSANMIYCFTIAELLSIYQNEADPIAAAETTLGILEESRLPQELLLKHGVTPDTKDIIFAIESYDKKLTQVLLLSKCVDINGKDENGIPFIYLLIDVYPELAEKLLLENEDKIEVDIKDDCNCTLLMAAAACGLKNIVCLLLNKNADVSATDRFGRTALAFAIRAGYPEIVRLLIENGADASLKDISGMTTLKMAQNNNLDQNNAFKEIIDLLTPHSPTTPKSSWHCSLF